MKNAISNTDKTRSIQPGLRSSTARSSDNYIRSQDLPRLIAVWPSEISNQSPAKFFKLIGKLKNALRAERQRGRTGHWSYDLNRHMGLVKALKAEMTALTLAQDRESAGARVRHVKAAPR
jgi:hypothetical protein